MAPFYEFLPWNMAFTWAQAIIRWLAKIAGWKRVQGPRERRRGGGPPPALNAGRGGAPQDPELDEQQREADHRHAAGAAAEKAQRRTRQVDAYAEALSQLHQTADWRTNKENCTNSSDRLVRRMRPVWPWNQAKGDLLSSRTSSFRPNCSFMLFSVRGARAMARNDRARRGGAPWCEKFPAKQRTARGMARGVAAG